MTANNFGNMPVDELNPMEGGQTGLAVQMDKMAQTRASMPMPMTVNRPAPGMAPSPASREPVAAALTHIPIRDLTLATKGNRELAAKISPGLFGSDGNINPTAITQAADGQWVVKVGDQQAWAGAAKTLTAESHASIKATHSMPLKDVDKHLAGEDESTIHAVKTFMEHKADKMWDGNDPTAQAARSVTGMAAIKMAQARGIISGQKVIPFTTPDGSTGQLDLGSGILSTVDHATGETKTFPKDQGNQLIQQLFQGDQKFFREVTHAAIPTVKKAPAKVDQMLKTFKQPEGQIAKKTDKDATLEAQFNYHEPRWMQRSKDETHAQTEKWAIEAERLSKGDKKKWLLEFKKLSYEHSKKQTDASRAADTARFKAMDGEQ